MVGASLLLLSCSGSGPKTSTNEACLPPAVDAVARIEQRSLASLSCSMLRAVNGALLWMRLFLTWAFVSVPTRSAVNMTMCFLQTAAMLHVSDLFLMSLVSMCFLSPSMTLKP